MNQRIVSPEVFVEEALAYRYGGRVKLEDIRYSDLALLTIPTIIKVLSEIVPGIKQVSAWYRSTLPYLIEVSGKRLLIVETLPGAPLASAVLEELKVCGVRYVIYCGYVGSLCDDLRPGDVVVVEEAIVDEGVSRIYRPGVTRSFASRKLLNMVCEVLNELHVDYRVVRVWTTDAPYMETVERVQWFRDVYGCSCVDMETSALYTVGTYLGLEVCAVHLVSDQVTERGWYVLFFKEEFKEMRRRFCEILRNLCVELLTRFKS